MASATSSGYNFTFGRSNLMNCCELSRWKVRKTLLRAGMFNLRQYLRFSSAAVGFLLPCMRSTLPLGRTNEPLGEWIEERSDAQTRNRLTNNDVSIGGRRCAEEFSNVLPESEPAQITWRGSKMNLLITRGTEEEPSSVRTSHRHSP